MLSFLASRAAAVSYCACMILVIVVLGWGGKRVSVRITLSLFLLDPLSNPDASHVFVSFLAD